MKEKAIGLDLGTSSLGIAVSDALGIVHPRKAFFFPSKAYRRAIAHFYALVEETGVKVAALGLPLNMDGSEGPSALRSRKFKEIVEKERPDIAIVLVDERLTTVEAYENLRKGGMKASKKDSYIDSESAAIILESYLNGKGESHA